MNAMSKMIGGIGRTGLGLLLVGGILGLAIPAGATTAPKPVIRAVAAVPRVIKPVGATVHYLAETVGATHCELTSSPLMPGLPMRVACNGTNAIAEASFKVPASATNRYINVGLYAYGPGGSAVETVVLQQTIPPKPPAPVITKNANGKPFVAGQKCPAVDLGSSLSVKGGTIICIVKDKVDRWEKA